MRCWKLEVGLAQDENIPDDVTMPTPSPLNINCLEWATCPLVSDAYETRIMDTTICVIDPINGLHLIAAVYSDSVIRFWLFDEKIREFVLVADGAFHGKCILQVKHAIVKGEEGTGDGILVFTSATDGNFLRSYESGGLKTHQLELAPPVYNYQAHLSGVNCLDVFQRHDDRYLVATGGEDNALAVAVLDVSWGGIGSEILSLIVAPSGDILKVPNAHASSLQGIFEPN
ncbi:hypothetical protein BC937DRAFT_95250 [Endogone sp. FLAS-F59071]|nr:hypothetical protein BC937DRAFT_95250 [Endogone sp. FLAS-F59071]|eukprot:RUS13480.1 hypothetical protein BC937DRAFT_95250 [Endogone sp. FLAS-F59071]